MMSKDEIFGNGGKRAKRIAEDKLLLDPTKSSTVESIAVFRDRHGGNFSKIKTGANYMTLFADTANRYYDRAVICYVEGLPVGYLYNELAKYFYPQIARLSNHGIDLVVRCKVDRQFVVTFHVLGEDDLLRHIDEALEVTNDIDLIFSSAAKAKPLEILSSSSKDELHSKIGSRVDWLCTQQWFLKEDLPLADLFGYSLLAYSRPSGVFENTFLSREDEESLLAVAYAFHRSPDGNLDYSNNVEIGIDGLGNSVHATYIGLIDEEVATAVVGYSKYCHAIVNFILKEPRSVFKRDIRWALERERLIEPRRNYSRRKQKGK